MDVEAVKDTCNDATTCKWSIAKLGYIEDKYIEYFTKRRHVKMPIINRGYYSRTQAIYQLIQQFLEIDPNGPKQIVVLGAGCDTTYFRLLERNLIPTRYVECDFPDINRRKIAAIRKQQVLWSALGFESSEKFTESLTRDKIGFDTDHYSLLSCDLRDLYDVEKQITRVGLDWSAPTFVLSECVLIYLEPDSSNNLISWFSKSFADMLFVMYEQIEPYDPFGRTMVRNIAARGCELKSIEHFPTCVSQVDRFLARGFKKAQCWTMKDVYYKFVDTQDREKKEKLELFDEVEEYHLLQSHYCILLATTKDSPSAFEKCWFE